MIQFLLLCSNLITSAEHINLDMPQNKASHWYSFTHSKCPHCHHGDMFVNKNPYALADISKMPTHCPVCGISFFPETGFYWGSMYMSYMITVIFSAVSVVILGLLSGWNLYVLVFGNSVLLILGFPIFFRYARVIWLQLNMPFNRALFEKFKSQKAD